MLEPFGRFLLERGAQPRRGVRCLPVERVAGRGPCSDKKFERATPLKWAPERSLAVLVHILRHIEMVLQRRQRLARPVFQFGIVTALGVALE
jgi:hypothetical protein